MQGRRVQATVGAMVAVVKIAGWRCLRIGIKVGADNCRHMMTGMSITLVRGQGWRAQAQSSRCRHR